MLQLWLHSPVINAEDITKGVIGAALLSGGLCGLCTRDVPATVAWRLSVCYMRWLPGDKPISASALRYASVWPGGIGGDGCPDNPWCRASGVGLLLLNPPLSIGLC